MCDVDDEDNNLPLKLDVFVLDQVYDAGIESILLSC